MRRFLLIGLLVVLGCEGSDGAKFALTGDPPRIFEGILEADETNQRLFFALAESGTLTFTATRIVATRVETGELITNPSLGVSLGRPASEDRCAVTLTNFLSEGESFAVFLESRAYCLVVSKSQALVPIDVVVEYTITATRAFE